jgi:HNH endonuclease domain protein
MKFWSKHMKREFRNFKIVRTCDKEYKDYHRYKQHLKTDFHSRCAYCNLLDTQITTPYEIDHYIPKNVFKNVWPELETHYDNLIYACKKCNRAKSDQYDGEIENRIIENKLFYDPVLVDYNTIFYRNDIGGISSDDTKGRSMINNLKLYRPIHNLAWICEIVKNTIDHINIKIQEVGEDSEKGKLLLEAKNSLNIYYVDCRDIFIANYNNDEFTMN